jgi:type IV pilus assembly protein PilQ
MKAKLAVVILVGLVACSLAPAQTNPAGESPTSATTTSDAAPSGAVIPLIQFQDVPLTTAIENLARQAGINYILDPKVGYGQPDERGVIKVQPNISIRWENLSAEQALTAMLINYDLQLVDDPKTRIARVTVKDPAAPDPLVTHIIQLKYAAPSNILTSVQTALSDKRSKVVPDARTSQLVVLATEKEIEGVELLVAQLDTPTKQVLIEAKILETTVNPRTAKGIDWSGTLESQNFTFGNGLTSSETTKTKPGGTTTTTLPGGRTVTSSSRSTSSSVTETILNPLVGGLSLNTADGFSPSTAFLNANGVSAALSFLNSSSDTKTISEPRMVTLDNQKATIDVGLLFPIVNVQAGTANTAGGSSISYSNLTVNLDVTPRITANDIVELKVNQGILKLGPKFTSTVGDLANEVDSFYTRKLETTVLIPSGNTLVMGGLISDDLNNANKKVPILGDLPLIGLAFRHESKERNRQNLIIFITPSIVQDGDFQPTASAYLKTTPDLTEEPDWTPWDDAKPLDWSKPVLDESYTGHRNPFE